MAVLFELDLNPMDAEVALARAWSSFDEDLPHPPGAQEFARDLVVGVHSHKDALDEHLRDCSLNWRVERMARVDLAILRIGAYELLHCPAVPRRVVLNEAIELAKRFGTDDSGAFVNGILDQVAQRLGGAEPQPGGEGG